MKAFGRSSTLALVLVLGGGLAATACEPDEQTVSLGGDLGGGRSPASTGGVIEAAHVAPHGAGGGQGHDHGGSTSSASSTNSSASNGSSTGSAGATSDGPPPCGTGKATPCPLQGWMRGALDRALHAEDFTKLEGAFGRLAAMAPPGFDGWASFSETGRQAAHEHDAARVEQMCKACHAAFREQYRRSPLRSAPLR